MPTHVRSHAKINLGLAIGPTRPDGFHALATIYQTLAIYDRVTVTAERLSPGSTSEIQITCNDPRVPTDARNTCWKMVELALAELKIHAQVTLHIEKTLPVQGGMGAGSANAAATLIGLERELGVTLPQATRLAVAAKVGSDVPLFLVGGTVLGAGRGEVVTELPDLPDLPCVVAVPQIGVSTPQAFRDWDTLAAQETKSKTGNKALTIPAGSDRLEELSRRWVTALAGPDQIATTASGVSLRKDRAEEPLLRLVRAGIENDFECVVFPLYPSLHGILQTLRIPSSQDSGALYAALSGSGSALFGLYATEAQAQTAMEQLAAGGVPALQTRTMGRAEYWDKLVELDG